MSPLRTFATAGRVLLQLLHDPRTVGLILIVPCILIALLKYVFDTQPSLFNHVAPLILGIFPLLMMFLVASIATLRERKSGTLDRLLTMPMGKLDFIFGYAWAFALLALVQAVVVSAVALGLLGVTVLGGAPSVVFAAVMAAFLGMALGLFVSAFATSEFQAVELVMPILMPQILLCGLFAPRDHMAQVLQWLTDVFPLTYSVDAMRQIALHTTWTSQFVRDLLVVLGCTVVALILGSLTIRRHSN